MDPLLVCGPQIKSPGLRSLLPAHFLIFRSSLKFMIPQISVKCWLCTGQAMFCNLALTPLAQSPYSHQSHKSPLKFKGHFSICIIKPSLCTPREPSHFLLGTFSFLGFPPSVSGYVKIPNYIPSQKTVSFYVSLMALKGKGVNVNLTQCGSLFQGLNDLQVLLGFDPLQWP